MAVWRQPGIEDGVHLHLALCGRRILRPARLPLGRDSDDQRRGIQRGALRAGLLPLSGGLFKLRPLPAVYGHVQVRAFLFGTPNLCLDASRSTKTYVIEPPFHRLKPDLHFTGRRT